MKLRILVVSLSTLICSTALADEVAIFPVNGTNIAAGEGDAIGALFAQAYSQVSGQRAVAPDATRSIVESSKDARSAAEALAASEYIIIDAIRLTTKIKLIASRYASSGSLQYRVEMTALSLDDVENVAVRLAAALYNRQTPEQTRTINSITQAEGEEPNHLFSEKVIGMKLQFTAILAVGQAIDPTISALFDMRFEGESYFLELGIGAMLPTNAWQSNSQNIRHYGGIISELGANYYFLNDDISLYAGAGVLPRLIGGTNLDLGVRLAVYAQGGVMFFRQSSTRLYADFRVAQNLIPFQNHSYNYYGSYDPYGDPYGNYGPVTTHESFPTELTISLGIGW